MKFRRCNWLVSVRLPITMGASSGATATSPLGPGQGLASASASAQSARIHDCALISSHGVNRRYEPGEGALTFCALQRVRCGAHTFAAGTLLFLAPNMRAPARDSSGADCDLRLRPPGKVCMTQAQNIPDRHSMHRVRRLSL